jgi:hypothetical protein
MQEQEKNTMKLRKWMLTALLSITLLLGGLLPVLPAQSLVSQLPGVHHAALGSQSGSHNTIGGSLANGGTSGGGTDPGND